MSDRVPGEGVPEAPLDDDPVQLYEQAPCGYLSTAPDGRIVRVNATFAAWTGYPADALVGRRFVDLLSVGSRVYHETHYAPLLRMQGSAREIAVDVVRHDGSRLPVLLNARLDRDEHDQPQVVRMAVFDATERRGYERELLRAKERAEASEERARTLARTLQQTLIPPELPTVDHLDLAGHYRPAGDGTEVGGDFYDVLPVTADDWLLMLGDVSGKGAEAAVVTALVRYTLRATALLHERPSRMLARLDDVLQRHQTERHCTCMLVSMRRTKRGWTATLATGGHPPPVLLRHGAEPELLPVHGSLVGVVPDAVFRDEQVHLGPGDAIVLYTDGVTEARSPQGFFDEAGLLRSLRRARDGEPELGQPGAASRIVSGLVDDVLAFQSGRPRDDIGVLAAAVTGPP